MGLFSRFFGAKDAPSAAIPEGQRAYAIGDIHGRDDLFADLIERIDADSAARGEADVTLVLLGDLIDRGPASPAVIDRAIALKERRKVHALKGNHEEAFLKALNGDEQAMEMLLRFGGDATLVSYGIPGIEVETLDMGSLLWKAASAVPRAHLDFMAAMEDKVAIGDYLFVHAGVRPGVALDKQVGADLRWIREDFLKASKHHGAMIVHGHSIVEEPELLPNRLGIDTGAYASGRLTALGLEGEERWLLQT
jgi:serine/threonine protein phosphatase 1